jgi:transposase
VKLTQSQKAIKRFETVMWAKGAMNRGVHIANAARDAGVARSTLQRWMDRYATEGIKGLRDLPRSGRPAKLVSR